MATLYQLNLSTKPIVLSPQAPALVPAIAKEISQLEIAVRNQQQAIQEAECKLHEYESQIKSCNLKIEQSASECRNLEKECASIINKINLAFQNISDVLKTNQNFGRIVKQLLTKEDLIECLVRVVDNFQGADEVKNNLKANITSNQFLFQNLQNLHSGYEGLLIRLDGLYREEFEANQTLINLIRVKNNFTVKVVSANAELKIVLIKIKSLNLELGRRRLPLARKICSWN